MSNSHDEASEGIMLGTEGLVRDGMMSFQTLEFLEACLLAKLNLAISGPPRSGKRKLLYSLASLLPEGEQILVIQNPDEPSLAGKGITTLRANLSSAEGKHIITRRYLLTLAPKMHPQRLIVDCVEGLETVPLVKLLFAMGGVIFSIVADSPKDALSNLERVHLSEPGLDMKTIRRMLSGSLDLIIQLQRLNDGSAGIASISEISDAESDTILLQDIFVRQGVEKQETESVGVLCPTGIKPRFVHRLHTLGISLPGEAFVPPHKKKRAAS